VTELKQEAVAVMKDVRDTLKGLLIEMKGANRRHMDASDFSIDEFRRLSAAVERVAAQLEKDS
jgi:hypothetical protein